jgi:LDH2 family malate/lactate/ureidoglycolate dehydrogenase
MSEEIRVIVPKNIAEALRRRSQKAGVTLDQLVLRAIVRELELEMRGERG